jgi:hypothetical protein
VQGGYSENSCATTGTSLRRGQGAVSSGCCPVGTTSPGKRRRPSGFQVSGYATYQDLVRLSEIPGHERNNRCEEPAQLEKDEKESSQEARATSFMQSLKNREEIDGVARDNGYDQ